jgi:DUF4097 and DUF4098 domain-containing protein YvlB
MIKSFNAILIICFVFISITLNACSIDYISKFDNNLQVIHEKTFTIQPGENLNLETSFGDVMITPWEKNEVYIKVLGNKKTAEKVIFSFDGSNDQIEIIAKHEKSFWGWSSNGMRLRFEIKVPSSFNTQVRTSGGDVRIGGIKGENKIKTSGGDISAKETSGVLILSTSGGDITIEKIFGEASLSTSGGDIKCKNFEGYLKAATSGGDIDLSGRNAKIEAKTSGGDITLHYTGENKGIELSTSGGDIQIKVPSDFNASADLRTAGGSISCDLNTSNVVKISSSKFEADLNKGGKPFLVKTSGGSIKVRKN